eukprot:TRINITY_DN2107_c0_g1_i1.p1 TRINITY_DN2107_c0_g1~~TRINITY_DN2107_c0_g1_i1.p1  ORF type:complete len:917 (+),score=262.72 TRINITY_DN2107_c0_g1_i1:45-2753(+)
MRALARRAGAAALRRSGAGCAMSGYAAGRQEKAEKAGNAAKAQQWQGVIDAIAAGTYTVGARAPDGSPDWVTPSVLTGGFVSGHACGGPVLAHEHQLQRIAEAGGAFPSGCSMRGCLNLWSCASREGGEFWLARLDAGTLRVDYPEEAAALCLALLPTDARDPVLKELQPWFGTLRFYPRLCDESQVLAGGETFRCSVSDVCDAISDWRSGTAHQMRNADVVRHLHPLYDDIVALCRRADGLAAPCSGELREHWLRVQKAHDALTPAQLDTKRYKKGNMGLLYQQLKDWAGGKAPKVKLVQKVLRDIAAKRARVIERLKYEGGPEAAWAAYRADGAKAQTRMLVGETQRKAMLHRLRRLPLDDGLGDEAMARVLAPVSPEEAQDHGGSPGDAGPVRTALEARVRRGRRAPLSALIENGNVPSPEVMASVSQRLVAALKASMLPDYRAAAVYGLLKQAFLRRRSVLLLNLESQVRMHDLPWARALLAEYPPARSEGEQALLAASSELVGHWLCTWPHRELPNELVKVFRELGVKNMCDGLAADIFEEAFGVPFLVQAQTAARELGGTLYARYYGLKPQPVLQLQPQQVGRGQRSKEIAPNGFLQLCREARGMQEAKPSRWQGNYVARNGATIEAAACMTTHNLLHLMRHTGRSGVACVGEALRAARVAATELVRIINAALALSTDQYRERHARLTMTKDAAAAWRQMVALLAVCEAQGAGSGELGAFFAFAEDLAPAEGPAQQEQGSPTAKRTRVGHSDPCAAGEGAGAAPDCGLMVYVSGMAEECHAVELRPDATVGDLRRCVPPAVLSSRGARFRLCYQGQRLTDERCTLADAGIGAQCTVHVQELPKPVVEAGRVALREAFADLRRVADGQQRAAAPFYGWRAGDEPQCPLAALLCGSRA